MATRELRVRIATCLEPLDALRAIAYMDIDALRAIAYRDVYTGEHAIAYRGVYTGEQPAHEVMRDIALIALWGGSNSAE